MTEPVLVTSIWPVTLELENAEGSHQPATNWEVDLWGKGAEETRPKPVIISGTLDLSLSRIFLFLFYF